MHFLLLGLRHFPSFLFPPFFFRLCARGKNLGSTVRSQKSFSRCFLLSIFIIPLDSEKKQELLWILGKSVLRRIWMMILSLDLIFFFHWPIDIIPTLIPMPSKKSQSLCLRFSIFEIFTLICFSQFDWHQFLETWKGYQRSGLFSWSNLVKREAIYSSREQISQRNINNSTWRKLINFGQMNPPQANQWPKAKYSPLFPLFGILNDKFQIRGQRRKWSRGRL